MRRNSLFMVLLLVAGVSLVPDATVSADAPAGVRGSAAVFQTLQSPSVVGDWIVIGSRLFFVRSRDNTGASLWVSDGTTAGTQQLAAGFIAIGGLTAVGDTLFFIGFPYNAAEMTSQLWRSDGSPAGTVQVRSFPMSQSPGGFVSAGGLLFFTIVQQVTSTATATFYDTQLWRSDGSADGTIAITDTFVIRNAPGKSSVPTPAACLDHCRQLGGIGPQPPPSYTSITGLRHIGPILLFNVNTTSSSTILWRSDGTTSGTQPLIYGLHTCSEGHEAAISNQWVFCAYTDPMRYELWRTDGSAAGTIRIFEFNNNAYTSAITAHQGLALFVQYGYPVIRFWQSDGSAAGTSEVFMGQPFRLFQIAALTHNRLVFFTQTDTGPLCLWESDGTLAGSTSYWCDDRATALLSQEVTDLWPLRDGLIFRTHDYRTTDELWYTDGTAAGTRSILAFDPASTIHSLGVIGDRFLFKEESADGVTSLWSFANGPAGFIRLPGILGAPPAGTVQIPISYGTNGAGASGVRITLTLPPGVSYRTDSTGSTPTISGAQVVWQLPAIDLLATHTIGVEVNLPDGELGTRLPLTATIETAEPSVDSTAAVASGEIMLAKRVFLPINVGLSPLVP